ncbi:DAZ-associated protein 2 [Oxyura jamaicensis]|uniref:DAZ-associated protein 2 n=1 Tax=Oxyura jamaicensis TaxID=8884 RepID=UPI0015A684D7|nr:DAZ-associated protein 2 [Oxyura jamaicensis]
MCHLCVTWPLSWHQRGSLCTPVLSARHCLARGSSVLRLGLQEAPANPPVYPQTLPLPQPPPYTDAPPAYSELYRPSFVPLGAATVPTMSAAYPGTSVFLPVAQSVAVGPIGSSVPMAYYPVGPVYPPGSTVLVEGGFDAGARFGAGGTASIPPPPPGCPPNAAQLAVMQGANVLVTQRKGNFFLGGSDGGYTIW